MESATVMRAGIVLGILVAVLAGCAGSRPFTPAEAEIPSAFPFHTVPQIEGLVAGSATPLEAMHARASLSVTSPDRSGRFSSEIRLRGDSLYFTISPGLGIEAVRVLATSDSLFVYDRLDNRVRFGSIRDAEALIPVPLGGDQLVRNIVGALLPRADEDWEVTADSNRYMLQNPSGTERFVVDPALWRVVRYERFAESGDLVEERRYETFADVAGHIVPQRLVFSQPEEQTTLVLTYREIDPDPGPMSFNLRVSEGARWTPVSQ